MTSYIKSLKEFTNTSVLWKEFTSHFDEVNPHFLAVLKKKYPKLNNNDIRFLCYIYMNMDLKEISMILNISLDSCKKRKRRIAQKMGVKTEDLLNHMTEIS